MRSFSFNKEGINVELACESEKENQGIIFRYIHRIAHEVSAEPYSKTEEDFTDRLKDQRKNIPHTWSAAQSSTYRVESLRASETYARQGATSVVERFREREP